MSTISQIANKKNTSGGAKADLGQLGNNLDFGTPLHLIRMTKGTVIPASTVFNKSYIDGQTKAGIFSPIIGADDFAESSSDDSFNTNTKGVNRLSVEGLPNYEFIYQQGNEFYRQLSKLKSFKESDWMIGDENGNWKLAANSNGDYVGLTAGQVLPKMTKMKVQGGDPESKTLVIQFLDRKQFDENYAIIERNNLDFDPEDLEVVNPVNVSITTVPSNTDTTLNVSALLAADNNTGVTGLLAADWQVKVNGSVVSNTLVESGSGAYVLTISALATADVVTVELISTTADTSIVLSGDVLYRSNSTTATVIA